MNKTRLSFIIPVYQVVQYLDQCLSSISVQPLEDMEVWVIDDGSTDGSAEICDKWAEEDHRFHVIHTPNQGVSMARNLGMEKASGEWICFVDGDDWIEQDFTEKLAFDHYKDADIVLFGSSFINAHGEVRDKRIITKTGLQSEMVIDRIIARILDPYARLDTALNVINYRDLWGKMYRAEFLQKHHLQNTQGMVVGEDAVMNLNVYLCNPRIYGSTIMEYFYRYNMTSISNRYNNAITEAYQREIQEMKRVLLAYHRMTDFQEQYYGLYIDSILACMRLDYCHPENPLPYSQRRADFLKLRNLADCDIAFQTVDFYSLDMKTKWILKCMRRRSFRAVDMLYKLRPLYRRLKCMFQTCNPA